MSLTREWHVAIDDTAHGPFSDDQLKAEIASGNVTLETLVWCDGQEGWTKAGELSDLFPALPPPLPPAPLHLSLDTAPPPMSAPREAQGLFRRPSTLEEALSDASRATVSGYIFAGMYALGGLFTYLTSQNIHTQSPLSQSEMSDLVLGMVILTTAIAGLTYWFSKKHYLSIVVLLGLWFAFEAVSKLTSGAGRGAGWVIFYVFIGAGFIAGIRGALFLRRIRKEETARLAETQSGGTAEQMSGPRDRRGIISRHWRGELSLPVSYWLVGTALTVALLVLVSTADEFIAASELGPSSIGLFTLTWITIVTVITIWQMVGIWRSAGDYIRKHTPAFWGYAARAAIVLGILQYGSQLNKFVPLAHRSVELVMGLDDTLPHQLRLLRGGTEVELAGGMSIGTAKALKAILDAAPAIKVVHLNSDGGFVAEGYRVNRVLSERKLATYTSARCASACTIAYLGGSERYIAPNGALGFHSSSFGSVDSQIAPELNDDMAKTLRAYGAQQWFIDKAFATPASSMWYPTHEELINAGIVSSVVDSNQFALSGVGTLKERGEVEANLRKSFEGNALMEALKSQETSVYEALIASMAQGFIEGKSVPELQKDIFETVASKMMPKYLRDGQDDELLAYWTVQFEMVHHLSAANPQTCLGYIFPEARDIAWSKLSGVSAELIAKEQGAMAKLVSGGLKGPGSDATPSEAEFSMVLKGTANAVPDARDVMLHPKSYFDRPELVCSTYREFYRQVLSLPRERAAVFLRFLGSEDS